MEWIFVFFFIILINGIVSINKAWWCLVWPERLIKSDSFHCIVSFYSNTMDQTEGNARKNLQDFQPSRQIIYEMGVFDPLEQWSECRPCAEVDKCISTDQQTDCLYHSSQVRNVLRVSCLQWAKLVLITCSAEQTNFIQSSPWPPPGRGRSRGEKNWDIPVNIY